MPAEQSTVAPTVPQTLGRRNTRASWAAVTVGAGVSGTQARTRPIDTVARAATTPNGARQL